MLTFRPLTRDDFSTVVAAYHRQWGQFEDASIITSATFMSALFEINTFAYGAFLNDTCMGIALGHTTTGPTMPLSNQWKSHATWLQEHRQHENLAENEKSSFEIIESANEKIRQRLKTRNASYQARLDFLWVAPAGRGQGISKSLLNAFHAHLQAQGISSYALFTDPYSDVSFYERAPWVKIRQQPWESTDPKDYSILFARSLS